MPKLIKQGYAMFINDGAQKRVYLLQSFNTDFTAETQEISDVGLTDADWASPESTKKSGTASMDVIYAVDTASTVVGWTDLYTYFAAGTELTFTIVETKVTGSGIDATIEPVTASDITTGETTEQITFTGLITGVSQAVTQGEYATGNASAATRGEPTITTITGTA